MSAKKKQRKVVRVRATLCATAREAVRRAAGDGSRATVLLNGRPAVISRLDAKRLAAAGAGFAYLYEHRGRVMTVPVGR